MDTKCTLIKMEYDEIEVMIASEIITILLLLFKFPLILPLILYIRYVSQGRR